MIEPGENHHEKFALNDGTWDLSECSVDAYTEIDIGAVLEIGSDENTVTYGVITGHYESNKLQFTSMSEIIN